MTADGSDVFKGLEGLVSDVDREALTGAFADHMAATLRAKTIETIRAFGFDSGFFNIEFWLTDDGVRLTEVNGRSAACFGSTRSTSYRS